MVDAQELEARRRQLETLKAKVAAQRAAASRDGRSSAPPGTTEFRPSDGMGLLLNVLAARIAENILGPLYERAASDEPTLPGTDFTENGVKKLLVLVKQRADTPEAGGRIVAKWLLGFLTRPALADETMVAGVNLEQLKQLVALLERVRARNNGAVVETAEAGETADAALRRIEEIEQSVRKIETEIDQLAREIEAQPRSRAANRSKAKPPSGAHPDEKETSENNSLAGS